MLKLIKNKPYKLLWSVIPVILTLSFFEFNREVDLQLHDTYIVMRPINVALLLSIFAGLTGLVYWLMRNKKLVDWLMIFHVIITIVAILIIVIYILFLNNILSKNIDSFETIHQSVLYVVLIFMMSQLLFLVNIGIGLIKN